MNSVSSPSVVAGSWGVRSLVTGGVYPFASCSMGAELVREGTGSPQQYEVVCRVGDEWVPAALAGIPAGVLEGGAGSGCSSGVDVAAVGVAWLRAACGGLNVTAQVLAVEQELDYGRQAVAQHVARRQPHGIFCSSCGHRYPCRIVLWGMRLLQARGWDLPGVIGLVEAVQEVERL